MKRSVLVAAPTIALAMVVAGCSGGNSSASGSQNNGDALIIGQGGGGKILYGGVQSGIAVALPSTQLFASPVRYTDSFTPKPYLAKSWKMAKDGLTLTLNLVHDATFTDGTPVTAKDVKFSIGVVRKYHPFGQQIWGSLKSVDTPDKHTVVIHFTKPSPAVMIGLGPGLLPVLPEHIYGNSKDLRTDPQLSHDVVGSGPYKLDQFVSGQKVVMSARKDFFMKGKPETKNIIIKYFNDATSEYVALKNGEINFETMNDPAVLNKASKQQGLTVAKKGYEAPGALVWLEFNTKNTYLKNPKVRQALAYATNVKFMINQLQEGFTKRSPSPIATGSPFYDPNLPTYPYNIAKAKKLLDEAGLKPGPNGTRFDLRLTYDPGSPAYGGNIANALKPQWAKIGVNVTIDSPADEPTWETQASNYNFDVTVDTVWNWGDPAIGVSRTYVCSNIHKGVVWANMTRYCNPKVDQLFAEAATEPNPSKRKAAYFQVQQILTRDLPVYVMMNWPITNVYSSKVKNPPNGIWGVMAPMLDTTVGK